MSEWFWKKINTFTGCLAALFLLALVILAANIEISDFDLWLHLAAGRFILLHKFIPSVDILSCTISGQPWINHEWLFQIILTEIYQIFGPDGLSTLQVIVVGMTFIILFFLGFDRGKFIWPICSLFLVLIVYQLRLTLRPDIFSLLFFTIYVQILAMNLNWKRSIIFIFLIQILWVNMHGFFIIGPIIVGIASLTEFIKRKIPLPFQWNDVGRLTDKEYSHLKFCFLAVVCACFINPYFVEGAVYPFKILYSLGHSDIFFRSIGELQRPITLETITNIHQYPAYKILIALSLVGFLFNYKRVDIGSAVLWLFFLFLSLSAVRNVVYFSVAAYLSMMINFQFENPVVKISRKVLSKRFGLAFLSLFHIIIILMLGKKFMLMSGEGYYDFSKSVIKSNYGGISLTNYPTKAVDFLENNKVKGNFFNDFNSGAYLLGRLYPSVKVFIDGRTEVYGERFYKDYQKIWFGGDGDLFAVYAEKFNITGAFLNAIYLPVPRGILKYLYERHDWNLVYFGGDAVIFLKDTPENKSIIQRYEIDLDKKSLDVVELKLNGRVQDRPVELVNKAYVYYNLGFYEKALVLAQDAVMIFPGYAKAHQLITKIYLEKQEYDKALIYAGRTIEADDQDVEAKYHYAYALYKLHQYKESLIANEAVLKEQKNHKTALFLKPLIFIYLHEFDNAGNSLAQAVKYYPYESSKIIKIAEVFTEEKSFDHALRAYQYLINVEDKKLAFPLMIDVAEKMNRSDLVEEFQKIMENLNE